MILLLDTSCETCRLSLRTNDQTYDYEWLAGRQLAKGLLEFIQNRLALHGKTINDITGLGVFQGPGSFTGLRIGLTVCNSLADGLQIPIVGGVGADWQDEVIKKLQSGENQKIVLPYYGRDANISLPKK